MTTAVTSPKFTRIRNTHRHSLTRIGPDCPRVSRLSDLWRDRYLLWMFTKRDIKVRYKQTLLGSGWAVLQPLLTMLVLTLVFSRVAKVPSGGIPYPVFVLCGLLPWQFFSYGLVRSSGSLVESRYLLTKLYVPRLILPVSAVMSGLPEFVLALAMLLGVMAIYSMDVSFALVLVLPLVLLVAFASLSIGLFLSALNVRYRDVGYLIPFFTQLLFFITPVAYPISLVPQRWQFLYAMNPMTAVVDIFRYALIGSSETHWRSLMVTAGSLGVLFFGGLLYFQHAERTFADVV